MRLFTIRDAATYARNAYRARRNTRWFVDAQAAGAADKNRRMRILRRFRAIDRHVPRAHSELDLLIVADWILRDDRNRNAIVEAGCYKGAGTAKLSIVAKETGRRLYACDSFAGLPEPGPEDRLHRSLLGRTIEYTAGDYAGTLAEVQDNIRTWGEIDACEFAPGLFADTLPGLMLMADCVLIDVDFIASARDCLRWLWPRLRVGGRFFTHEATVYEFVLGLMDQAWWHGMFSTCPPVLFGAGFGLGPSAESLAYFEKPADTEPSIKWSGDWDARP